MDGELAADCAGAYDPTRRSCGAGSDDAFAGLQGGLDVLAPGDTLWIRGGSYDEQLAPTQSGSPDAEITIAAYDDESVALTGIGEPALWIVGRAHLTIRDLEVNDCLGFGRLEDTEHITIENNRFVTAQSSGTTGALKLVRADFTTVRGNHLEDAADNMVVQESEHTLVQDNNFFRASHSLLSIRCSSFNVVRSNTFDNPDQKAAEIYDCEGVSDAPFELDATKRNLFEGNAFVHTLGSDESYRYNGIQYAGQTGIVRNNVFTDNLGGGLAFQVYPDEALHNYEQRAYNNTFVDNWCYGISASGNDAKTYYDNRVQNNLLLGNLDCAGAPSQTAIGNAKAVVLSDNAELEDDPGFVDADALDFRLVESSDMVDAGVFVTQTVRAGRGQIMGVQDARYFYDGFELPGEPGDVVMLDGSRESARITAIDLATHTLSLDAPLTWSAGQGVHVAYAGAAPDMGAFEHGLEEPGGGDDGDDDDDGADSTGDGAADSTQGGADAGGDGDDGPSADGPLTSSGGTGTDGGQAAGGDGGDDGGCACSQSDQRGTGRFAIVLLMFAVLGARRRR